MPPSDSSFPQSHSQPSQPIQEIFTPSFRGRNLLLMVPELEKPRITEIHVRIDCNGCVQKIKKALYGIKGIYDVYIDPQKQKLTVVGWADPEKIIKAIKKSRKTATICSHSEVSEPQPPTQPAEGGEQSAPDAANGPPSEKPPTEEAPQAEPAKEAPPPPPPPENPPPVEKASPPEADPGANQPVGPSETRDVEEIHVIHHHPRPYGYNDHWNNHTGGYGFRPDGPQYVTTHSYNSYKPSPYISAYAPDYAYPRSPPQSERYGYGRTDNYVNDYHSRGNGDGNNITSMFSDENPNACRIV